MSINFLANITSISEDEFHSLDYKVMELAFKIHNELGRFWDEKIYQKELAYRCQISGMDCVETEVPIKVSFEDFHKIFYIDLLINNSIIYELKTVKTLTGEHKNQTLNYLFLLGIHYGKLINFRPSSVEYHFVSTKLTTRGRYNFKVFSDKWINCDEDSVWFKEFMLSLLNEWGAFLDIHLFYDAICYFRGGVNNVVQKIKIRSSSRELGTQKIHLLNQNVAFKISSVNKALNSFENHIRRFLNFSPLKAIQWVNFNRHLITFKTILK